MALVPFSFQYPALRSIQYEHNTVASLDADNELQAICGQVPYTGTIDEVYISFVAVTQFPANGLRVSLQDLDANGDPDGTEDQYRDFTSDPGNSAFVSPGKITSDGTDSGAQRAVTAGDYLAVVVGWAGAFTAGDDVDLVLADLNSTVENSWPATRFSGNAGSTWSDTTNTLQVILKYTDGTEVAMNWPAIPQARRPGLSDTFPYSTTTGGGWHLVPPVDIEIAGIAFGAASITADIKVEVLLDSDKSVLATAVLDGAYDVYNDSENQAALYFDSVVTLEKDTAYKILLYASSGSGNVKAIWSTTGAVASATFSDSSSYPCHLFLLSAGPTYVSHTDRAPQMSMILSQVDPQKGGLSLDWWSPFLHRHGQHMGYVRTA